MKYFDVFIFLSFIIYITVLLVLALASEQILDEQLHHPTKLSTTIPGYIEERHVVVTSESFEEIKFVNLHPETEYMIFAVMDTTNTTFFPMSDDILHPSKPPAILPVRTNDERLEIEWSRMDTNMRLVELQASIRCEFVQMRAHFHYPIILVPTTEELNSAEVKLLISPHTMDIDSINNLRTKLKKHITIFLDWWIGSEKQTSKVRSEFHLVESLYATKDANLLNAFIEDGYGLNSEELLAMKEYVRQLIVKPDTTPILPANPQSTIKGIATTDDSFAAASSIDEEQARMNAMGLNGLKKFRSWYKGGFIVREREKQEQAK